MVSEMRVLLNGANGHTSLKDSDGTNFAQALLNLGHKIVGDIDEGPEIVICVDYARKAKRDLIVANAQGIPTVLVINEPSVVQPDHARESVRRMFNRVIEVGRPGSPSPFYPQTWQEMLLTEERRLACVLVNADKWSFDPGGLYDLRLEAASKTDLIDTFGHGWDRPNWIRLAHRFADLAIRVRARQGFDLSKARNMLSRPMNFGGAIDDKIATMSKYKVALVIENSFELVTEKFFDALFAGCVPVYVGRPLDEYGLPHTLAVSCEPDCDSILRGIEVAMRTDLRRHHRATSQFLSLESTIESWRADKAISRTVEACFEL